MAEQCKTHWGEAERGEWKLTGCRWCENQVWQNNDWCLWWKMSKWNISQYTELSCQQIWLCWGFFLMVLYSLSSSRESYPPFLDSLNPNQVEIRKKVPNSRIVCTPSSIKKQRPKVSGKTGFWIIVLKTVFWNPFRQSLLLAKTLIVITFLVATSQVHPSSRSSWHQCKRRWMCLLIVV